MSPKIKFNDYIIENEITKIKVKYKDDVLWAIIDTCDLLKLIELKYHWNARYDFPGNKLYVQCNTYIGGKHKVISLHKFILGYNGNSQIDHKNNNGLDNRRENLRIAGHKNNNRNRRSKNINNKSGYRNVCWIKGWYYIQLQVGGKNHRFKEKFRDVIQAADFAEKARQKYYGDYAGKS